MKSRSSQNTDGDGSSLVEWPRGRSMARNGVHSDASGDVVGKGSGDDRNSDEHKENTVNFPLNLQGTSTESHFTHSFAKHGIPLASISASPRSALSAQLASPQLTTAAYSRETSDWPTAKHAKSPSLDSLNFSTNSPVFNNFDFHKQQNPTNISISPSSPSPLSLGMQRKRRTSDISAIEGASPPFTAISPPSGSNMSISPTQTFKRPAWLGLTDLSHSPAPVPPPAGNHTHRSMTHLRSHSAPRSPQLLPTAHHPHNPPPGASPMSPSVFAINTNDVGNMPDLTLPGTNGLDEHWPAPRQIQAAVSHTHAANAESLLLSPPARRRSLSDHSPLFGPSSPPSKLTPPVSTAELPESALLASLPRVASDEFEPNYDISAMLQSQRRRKRSSRGSSGSLPGRKSRDNSLERKAEEATPSVHHKRPDLALPERSGWEYSDEESGDDDTDEGTDEDEPPSGQLFRTTRRRSYPDEPTSPVSPVSPKRGSPASPVSPERIPSPSQTSPILVENRLDTLAMADDESLSILERIFILSRSEYKEHRMAVTRALPQWVEQVDICSAVEYVLPLLNGLAADEDEVKVCLAQGLDRIMYHFFSKCPLADPEALNHSGGADDTRSVDELPQPMEIDERSHSATPLTASTHSLGGHVKLPRIPVGAFTPILGLLLMEPNVEVSSWTRAAVVRFLCRLNGKTIPLSFQDEEEQPEHFEAYLNKLQEHEHQHENYTLSGAARAALEEQIIVDVVLGLARLENEDETDAIPETAEPDSSTGRPPQSPDEEDWATVGATPPEESSPDWGMSLRSYARPDPPAPATRHHRHTSSTSALDADNEAIQGKVASMELVAAIVGADCVQEEQVASNFIPEIQRMVHEEAQRVRSVAASAIGPLAKSLPQELVVSSLLPLIDAFSHDPQPQVRRWTCLILPDVCSRLPLNLRHRKAIEAVQLFSQDTSRDVRSALSEICGPMIYSFKDYTIPVELMNWYLGRPVNSSAFSPDISPTTVQSFMSVLKPTTESEAVLTKTFSMVGHAPDSERALLSAYNLPAVVLTVGKENWHLLSDFYAELAHSKQASVRRCLAGSLHVVAGILGSIATSRDLLPVAELFLADVSDVREPVLLHFAEFCLALPLDESPGFVRKVQQSLAFGESSPPWRSREVVASQLVSLVDRFIATDRLKKTDDSDSSDALDPDDHAFPDLVHALMKDEVAAVRNAAIKAIPAAFKASRAKEGSLSPMHVFLRSGFAIDPSYRHRALYATCISLMVEQGLTAEDFGRLFLPDLGALSADPILNVRAEVSKLCRKVLSLGFYDQIPPVARSDLAEIYHRLHNDTDSLVREHLGQFHGFKNSRLPSLSSEFSSTPPSDGGLMNGRYDSDRSEDDMQLSSSTIRDLKTLASSDFDQVELGDADWPRDLMPSSDDDVYSV